MRCRLLFAVAILASSVAFGQATATAPSTAPATTSAPAVQGPARYEKTILGYEKGDKETPPPANATLFIGSSTFTRWKPLPAEFKEFTPINRAFGGSQFSDLLYYCDRMILAYKPKTVVIYCGTNDVTSKTPPEKVEANFEQLAEKIHAALPQTQVYFLSAIPAPSRVKVAAEMDALNALAQKYIGERPWMHYIDARYALSGEDKQPDVKLYVKDMVHPNEEGYKRLIPIIKAALGGPTKSAPAK